MIVLVNKYEFVYILCVCVRVAQVNRARSPSLYGQFGSVHSRRETISFSCAALFLPLTAKRHYTRCFERLLVEEIPLLLKARFF